jgi:hypothetical protein
MGGEYQVQNDHTICSILKGMRQQNTNEMYMTFISKIPVHVNVCTGEEREYKHEEITVLVTRNEVEPEED